MNCVLVTKIPFISSSLRPQNVPRKFHAHAELSGKQNMGARSVFLSGRNGHTRTPSIVLKAKTQPADITLPSVVVVADPRKRKGGVGDLGHARLICVS